MPKHLLPCPNPDCKDGYEPFSRSRIGAVRPCHTCEGLGWISHDVNTNKRMFYDHVQISNQLRLQRVLGKQYNSDLERKGVALLPVSSEEIGI